MKSDLKNFSGAWLSTWLYGVEPAANLASIGRPGGAAGLPGRAAHQLRDPTNWYVNTGLFRIIAPLMLQCVSAATEICSSSALKCLLYLQHNG